MLNLSFYTFLGSFILKGCQVIIGFLGFLFLFFCPVTFVTGAMVNSIQWTLFPHQNVHIAVVLQWSIKQQWICPSMKEKNSKFSQLNNINKVKVKVVIFGLLFSFERIKIKTGKTQLKLIWYTENLYCTKIFILISWQRHFYFRK